MRLRDQLIRHEGIRLFPYRDSVGVLTIGVGRNLESKGISKEEALTMLDNDIADAHSKLLRAYPKVAGLSQPRTEVLVNMTFNLGLNGVSKFKRMWAAIYKEDYTAAAAEMLDSKWARQVGRRALELAHTMKTGEEMPDALV